MKDLINKQTFHINDCVLCTRKFIYDKCNIDNKSCLINPGHR